MILRTPPAKRTRAADSTAEGGLNCDTNMLIFEDRQASDPSDKVSDHLSCAYECRQMIKSQIVDALEKAEKKVQEYGVELESVKGDLRVSESERKKLHEKLLYAEQELAIFKDNEERLQEQLLNEVKISEERSRKQVQETLELEMKLQEESGLRRSAELSASNTESKSSSLEQRLTRISEKLGRENARLADELERLKQESEFSISRNQFDLERMESRAVNAEKDSCFLRKQLEDSDILRRNEKEKPLKPSQAPKSAPDGDDEFIVEQLKSELRRSESELRELRKLKSVVGEMELLKKELIGERARRERAESDLRGVEDVRSSWKSFLNTVRLPESSTVEHVRHLVSSMKKEISEKTDRLSEAVSRLHRSEASLSSAERIKQALETEASVSKEKEKMMRREMNRIDLMLAIATEERDRLRTHTDGSGGDDTKAAEAMERLGSEQREAIDRLGSELKLCAERLSESAREMRVMERENDRLHSELSLLESKLGRGEFSGTTTKVLRMVNAPGVDSEAKKVIGDLQAELWRTKEKLLAIEDLSGDSGKLLESRVSEKMIRLREQVATLEKREERYKSVFAERISVFRRACCEIFGYKIVMDEHRRSNGIPVTVFTLQSVYAQGDDEKLVLEYESGCTSIMMNEYASQPEIARQIDVFVRKMSSVPAFTANLTVESFNRRTLS